jgi:hypothetical protein
MANENQPFLRKQAWDYFSTHASQRMTIFNFYIVLSSLTATSYFASFKSDSNLGPARPALGMLLCLFAFIFWKLDQRNKFLIKNAEQALRHFENSDSSEDVTKVFTYEEMKTNTKQVKGFGKLLFWRLHLSYSDCFNLVFLVFFGVGFVGTASSGVESFRHLDSGSRGWWKPLSFENTTFDSAALFDSDIALPEISKIDGKIKFRPSPEHDSEYDLGYIINVTVDRLDTKNVPPKYLQSTKEQHVSGEITVDPIKEVVYVVHFSFTLNDADGFYLAKLDSSPLYIDSGTKNNFQGIAGTPISAGVARRTRTVACTMHVDKCETCR